MLGSLDYSLYFFVCSKANKNEKIYIVYSTEKYSALSSLAL